MRCVRSTEAPGEGADGGTACIFGGATGGKACGGAGSGVEAYIVLGIRACARARSSCQRCSSTARSNRRASIDGPCQPRASALIRSCARRLVSAAARMAAARATLAEILP